jgi:hypothetical protein
MVFATSMTVRYPDYNHSSAGACRDAKRHVRLKASNECKSNITGSIQTSCIRCNKKMRFNTPTWTCSGKATYKCGGTSVSQDETNKNSSTFGAPIRKLRGALRKNTPRGQSPCLQYPNGSACRRWKASFKRAGGVRN